MSNLKFDARTINYILSGVMILLIIGSIFGSNQVINILSNQANNLVGLKAKSQALQTEQTNLNIAKKEVSKYSSLQKIAESIVPQNKDQAEAVREIVNIASESGITLTSITFPSSTLGDATTGASSGKLSLSQLTPVPKIPGVYSLPINVQDSSVSGAVSYPSFYNFLTMLEQNRLTSQVTSLDITPDSTNNGLITFNLTINEYIKPR